MKRERGDDERLREMLRRGDPAGGDPPSPADVARWRRAMLEAAAPRRAPAWRLVPVAGMAAAVVVAALVGVVLWRDPGAVPTDVATTAPMAVTVPVPEVPFDRTPEELPAPPAGLAPEVVLAPAPVVQAAAVREEPRRTTPEGRRTIHFTANRGTRIIWNIDPELQL